LCTEVKACLLMRREEYLKRGCMYITPESMSLTNTEVLVENMKYNLVKSILKAVHMVSIIEAQLPKSILLD